MHAASQKVALSPSEWTLYWWVCNTISGKSGDDDDDGDDASDDGGDNDATMTTTFVRTFFKK